MLHSVVFLLYVEGGVGLGGGGMMDYILWREFAIWCAFVARLEVVAGTGLHRERFE